MAKIVRLGGNCSSFWRGHTIRSAANPLLISHLFPAAELIVGLCLREAAVRGRLSRPTQQGPQHITLLWRAPFWGTWPKDSFQFWLLYFRQSTYTHPRLTASFQACLLTSLRFCWGKFSLTSIFWYLGEQVMCSAVMAQHSLCPAQTLTVSQAASARDAATCPHQPHAMGSGGGSQQGKPPEKAQPLSFPSCQCAGVNRNMAGHLPAPSRGFPAWTWWELIWGSRTRLTQRGSHACIKVPAWHNSSLVILEMSLWHEWEAFHRGHTGHGKQRRHAQERASGSARQGVQRMRQKFKISRWRLCKAVANHH